MEAGFLPSQAACWEGSLQGEGWGVIQVLWPVLLPATALPDIHIV